MRQQLLFVAFCLAAFASGVSIQSLSGALFKNTGGTLELKAINEGPQVCLLGFVHWLVPADVEVFVFASAVVLPDTCKPHPHVLSYEVCAPSGFKLYIIQATSVAAVSETFSSVLRVESISTYSVGAQINVTCTVGCSNLPTSTYPSQVAIFEVQQNSWQFSFVGPTTLVPQAESDQAIKSFVFGVKMFGYSWTRATFTMILPPELKRGDIVLNDLEIRFNNPEISALPGGRTRIVFQCSPVVGSDPEEWAQIYVIPVLRSSLSDLVTTGTLVLEDAVGTISTRSINITSTWDLVPSVSVQPEATTFPYSQLPPNSNKFVPGYPLNIVATYTSSVFAVTSPVVRVQYPPAFQFSAGTNITLLMTDEPIYEADAFTYSHDAQTRTITIPLGVFLADPAIIPISISLIIPGNFLLAVNGVTIKNDDIAQFSLSLSGDVYSTSSLLVQSGFSHTATSDLAAVVGCLTSNMEWYAINGVLTAPSVTNPTILNNDTLTLRLSCVLPYAVWDYRIAATFQTDLVYNIPETVNFGRQIGNSLPNAGEFLLTTQSTLPGSFSASPVSTGFVINGEVDENAVVPSNDTLLFELLFSVQISDLTWPNGAQESISLEFLPKVGSTVLISLSSSFKIASPVLTVAGLALVGASPEMTTRLFPDPPYTFTSSNCPSFINPSASVTSSIIGDVLLGSAGYEVEIGQNVTVLAVVANFGAATAVTGTFNFASDTARIIPESICSYFGDYTAGYPVRTASSALLSYEIPSLSALTSAQPEGAGLILYTFNITVDSVASGGPVDVAVDACVFVTSYCEPSYIFIVGKRNQWGVYINQSSTFIDGVVVIGEKLTWTFYTSAKAVLASPTFSLYASGMIVEFSASVFHKSTNGGILPSNAGIASSNYNFASGVGSFEVTLQELRGTVNRDNLLEVTISAVILDVAENNPGDIGYFEFSYGDFGESFGEKTVQLQQPTLELSAVTQQPTTPVDAGDIVNYSFQVTNDGPVDATFIVIELTMKTDVISLEQYPSFLTRVNDTYFQIPILLAQETISIEFDFKVSSFVEPATISAVFDMRVSYWNTAGPAFIEPKLYSELISNIGSLTILPPTHVVSWEGTIPVIPISSASRIGEYVRVTSVIRLNEGRCSNATLRMEMSNVLWMNASVIFGANVAYESETFTSSGESVSIMFGAITDDIVSGAPSVNDEIVVNLIVLVTSGPVVEFLSASFDCGATSIDADISGLSTIVESPTMSCALDRTIDLNVDPRKAQIFSTLITDAILFQVTVNIAVQGPTSTLHGVTIPSALASFVTSSSASGSNSWRLLFDYIPAGTYDFLGNVSVPLADIGDVTYSHDISAYSAPTTEYATPFSCQDTNYLIPKVTISFVPSTDANELLTLPDVTSLQAIEMDIRVTFAGEIFNELTFSVSCDSGISIVSVNPSENLPIPQSNPSQLVYSLGTGYYNETVNVFIVTAVDATASGNVTCKAVVSWSPQSPANYYEQKQTFNVLIPQISVTPSTFDFDQVQSDDSFTLNLVLSTSIVNGYNTMICLPTAGADLLTIESTSIGTINGECVSLETLLIGTTNLQLVVKVRMLPVVPTDYSSTFSWEISAESAPDRTKYDMSGPLMSLDMLSMSLDTAQVVFVNKTNQLLSSPKFTKGEMLWIDITIPLIRGEYSFPTFRVSPPFDIVQSEAFSNFAGSPSFQSPVSQTPARFDWPKITNTDSQGFITIKLQCAVSKFATAGKLPLEYSVSWATHVVSSSIEVEILEPNLSIPSVVVPNGASLSSAGSVVTFSVVVVVAQGSSPAFLVAVDAEKLGPEFINVSSSLDTDFGTRVLLSDVVTSNITLTFTAVLGPTLYPGKVIPTKSVTLYYQSLDGETFGDYETTFLLNGLRMDALPSPAFTVSYNSSSPETSSNFVTGKEIVSVFFDLLLIPGRYPTPSITITKGEELVVLKVIFDTGSAVSAMVEGTNPEDVVVIDGSIAQRTVRITAFIEVVSMANEIPTSVLCTLFFADQSRVATQTLNVINPVGVLDVTRSSSESFTDRLLQHQVVLDTNARLALHGLELFINSSTPEYLIDESSLRITTFPTGADVSWVVENGTMIQINAASIGKNITVSFGCLGTPIVANSFATITATAVYSNLPDSTSYVWRHVESVSVSMTGNKAPVPDNILPPPSTLTPTNTIIIVSVVVGVAVLSIVVAITCIVLKKKEMWPFAPKSAKKSVYKNTTYREGTPE